MKIAIASVVARRGKAKAEGVDALVAEYVHRSTRYMPVESVQFDSESALLESTARQPGRPASVLVLLDSRGQMLTSEEFARYLGRQQDEATQRITMGIGPADGWSDAARGRAQMQFSLGRVTLPHELARVVLAEQIYRACTILAGHPYHCGH